MPLVESADGRPEEPADLVPARRDEPTRERQPDVDPEVPRRPPDALWEAELEHRDRAAGPHDAGELDEGGARIVDVAEEVREGEVVERGVGEGQRVRARL